LRAVQYTVEPRQTGRLPVNGCPIAWARWGDPAPEDGPPIVLVHGASASIGWWDAVIAPLAQAGRHVVALELSGHADSGHREEYTGAQWAREVVAVTEQVAGGPALLAGHSLGGRVAIMAAAVAGPALFPRLVLVDAPTRRPGGPVRRPAPPRRGSGRVYATLEEAIDAFRLRPREPVHDSELLRRVAANAYRRADNGWRLKADLAVFSRISDEDLAEALGNVRAPLTLVWGTHSAMSDADSRAFLASAHPGETDFVEVDGHHHLTLDQGAEVAAVIASRWELLRRESRCGTLAS
jgi:pimeloyl-ACP methyl ester carboxylesterase